MAFSHSPMEAPKYRTEPCVPKYVLITAARNEEEFIRHTLESVVHQTVLPLRWVIVSDGSTDRTDELVREYAAIHPWIDFVRLPERAQRHFAGKVFAFNAGYARITTLDYDVVGNLDGDVSFDPDYIEFLLQKFVENRRLGVTGTPYREDNPIHDERFKSPEHVSGACQMFRRECFQEIGGYPAVREGGIDLIALLSAQAKGWQTKRFDDRFCVHHRNVGSGQHANVWNRLYNLGRKDYLLGSHPFFEAFRCVHQMRNKPYVVGGLVMLAAYMTALVRREARPMPSELVCIRRRDQMRRLRSTLRRFLR